VEKGEEGHFDAKEDRGDADFDVGVGEVLRGFEGPGGGGEEGDYELWFRALVMGTHLREIFLKAVVSGRKKASPIATKRKEKKERSTRCRGFRFRTEDTTTVIRSEGSNTCLGWNYEFDVRGR